MKCIKGFSIFPYSFYKSSIVKLGLNKSSWGWSGTTPSQKGTKIKKKCQALRPVKFERTHFTDQGTVNFYQIEWVL